MHRRNRPAHHSGGRGMSQITNISPFPFINLKVGDVFRFDSSVEKLEWRPNTFVKDGYYGGGSGVNLSVSYVVTSRYRTFSSSDQRDENCEIFPIASYDYWACTGLDNFKSVRLADRTWLEWYPRWYGLDLDVRRLGSVFPANCVSEIPMLDDEMRGFSDRVSENDTLQKLRLDWIAGNREKVCLFAQSEDAGNS